MIEQKCETCDFWIEGLCHRNPPSPFPMPTRKSGVIGREPTVSMGQICMFPMIGKDGWCGEWRHND